MLCTEHSASFHREPRGHPAWGVSVAAVDGEMSDTPTVKQKACPTAELPWTMMKAERRGMSLGEEYWEVWAGKTPGVFGETFLTREQTAPRPEWDVAWPP